MQIEPSYNKLKYFLLKTFVLKNKYEINSTMILYTATIFFSIVYTLQSTYMFLNS